MATKTNPLLLALLGAVFLTLQAASADEAPERIPRQAYPDYSLQTGYLTISETAFREIARQTSPTVKNSVDNAGSSGQSRSAPAEPVVPENDCTNVCSIGD